MTSTQSLAAELRAMAEDTWRLGTINKVRDLLRRAASAVDAASTPLHPVLDRGWQPIETAPNGQKIIAGYYNSLGNWRTIMARYFNTGMLEANTDYIDGDENGFAPEGWYEEGEAYSEALLPVDHIPTHWMPLPSPPSPSAGETE